ncbi:glyoxalase [Hahella sp. CCB-MM4]|uniref:VOC family protein n=1 Tax=Hahella sp. (strain CCB-MM4) TaxID=1926491 RepID=UPI000B9BDF8A|nr:VOC family protein [Hahella sp. CCB-MM4]OZG71627.1 glyoxalase [Hahella sp. CCB-MM4]
MEIERTGIILRVERFDECVNFYHQLFGLPILFESQEGDFRLACLDFYGAYLMIETGGMTKDGEKKDGEKTMAENPTRLRFNVRDIEQAAVSLKNWGIEPKINRYPWGTTINITDPDGNSVGIRDEQTFLKQLEN